MTGRSRIADNKRIFMKRFMVITSLLMAACIVYVSYTGITVPDFYKEETRNWQLQAVGQDNFDLWLVSPALLISTLMVLFNFRLARFVWAGVMLYCIYTFTIFSFDVHFNRLFIFYCLIMGLSFFSLLSFVYTESGDRGFSARHPVLYKLTGIYFLAIAILFYTLWLAEILPSILTDGKPPELAKTGLFTNPIHVLDLSVVLPGIFITGLMLLHKKRIGTLMAPVILTFFILMDLTIGYLIYFMNEHGEESQLSVALIMGIMTVLSLALLIFYFIDFRKNNRGSL